MATQPRCVLQSPQLCALPGRLPDMTVEHQGFQTAASMNETGRSWSAR
jgi:hypothetical protein